MNTAAGQHPVTEMVTGIDIVRATIARVGRCVIPRQCAPEWLAIDAASRRKRLINFYPPAVRTSCIAGLVVYVGVYRASRFQLGDSLIAIDRMGRNRRRSGMSRS
jgi:biotin carboxylase